MADDLTDMEGKFIDIMDITSVARSRLEAEKANEAKTDFLAMMSHEIRTPLGAIIGLSEAGLHRPLPEKLRADLETIHQAGAGLLAFINNTLDIAKIEAGGLSLVPAEYDLAAMISETVQMNLVRAGDKQFTFKLELDRTLPVRLFGDEIRVRQILNNLLSNAIKYTPAGGASLSVRWAPQSEGDSIRARLRFVVSDTGIGIRPEDVGKLFTEYVQVDTLNNRHIEGAGLGLAITRQLVTMMNGTIGVESEYGGGSVFTAEIMQGIASSRPLGAEEAGRLMAQCAYSGGRAAARPALPALRGKRVLVVDDMAANLSVARELLAPCGVAVDGVLRAREALELLRAGLPVYDAVLMDHRMPEMDGIEAVRLIRALGTEYAGRLPIIALTAGDAVAQAEKFLESGFNGFVAKPIDLLRLEAEMSRCLGEAAAPSASPGAPLEDAAGMDWAEDGVAIAGIDWAEGRRRYGEIPFRNILHAFLRHTPAVLARMESLLPEYTPDYVVAVHGLKSSCYGICAPRLGQMAAALEKTAAEGYSLRLQTNQAEFTADVQELLDELRNMFGRRQALRPKAAPAAETLRRMLDSSRHYRINQMEEALDELERYAYEDEAANDLVVWLREQTDDLAYGAIVQKLTAWLQSGENRRVNFPGPAQAPARQNPRRVRWCAAKVRRQ
ncbi:MAG: response regulator [Gracilibacteraceae bacterium]|nr:response regulator [Gracilibacteraceae bacterium]